MYSINENLPKTKLVKIQTKNNKTKKKKYQVEDQDIDYLKQVIRNKNKEVKRGGGKMEKLLQSNQEIEALLNRKKTKKQSYKNSSNQEQQNIENLLQNSNAVNKTCQEPPQNFKVEEVDLSKHTPESNAARETSSNNSKKEKKTTANNTNNNNTNFLEKIIREQKKSESNQNQSRKAQKTYTNTSTQTNIKGINKPLESRNTSNIDLSTAGIKMKSKSPGKSKISRVKKPTSKKTKKKEFPKELTKLSKKHTQFIEQLMKSSSQMKVKKTIKNKNLKNLKLDSSSINLSTTKQSKPKDKAAKKNGKSSNAKSTVTSKKSKKKIISANLKPPSPKRQKKKKEPKKSEKPKKSEAPKKIEDHQKTKAPKKIEDHQKTKELVKKTPETKKVSMKVDLMKEAKGEDLENPYQSVMEKLIKNKKDGKKYLKIKELSKADLKKKLIELELIKADSKAPIKVLRDIYFFYDITRMKLQK